MKQTKNEFGKSFGLWPTSLAPYLFFILSIGLIGCGTGKPAVVDRSVGLEVLRSIQVGRADLKSLEAEAKAEIRRGSRKVRFLASILAHEREGMFIEAGGFGFGAVHVSVRGDQVTVYVPAEAKAYRGRGRKAIEKLLGIPLHPKEWLFLLLGRTLAYPDKQIEAKSYGKRWVITAEDGKRVTRLTLTRPDAWLTRFWEKTPRDLAVVYGEPLPTVSGAYPSTLKIATPRTSLQLRFRRVVPNATFPVAHLQLDIPPGIDLEPIERVRFLKRK